MLELQELKLLSKRVDAARFPSDFAPTRMIFRRASDTDQQSTARNTQKRRDKHTFHCPMLSDRSNAPRTEARARQDRQARLPTSSMRSSRAPMPRTCTRRMACDSICCTYHPSSRSRTRVEACQAARTTLRPDRQISSLSLLMGGEETKSWEKFHKPHHRWTSLGPID